MNQKYTSLLIVLFGMGACLTGLMIGLLVSGSSVSMPLESTGYFVSSLAGKAPERASPLSRIGQDKIAVYSDRVTINMKGAEWATFSDTNSMDPVFDSGDYALQMVPKSASELSVGDIISFSTNQGIIIHRIIEIGYDGAGWYAITKGDNNPSADPDKVRFSQVKKVVVGIIY